MILDLDRFRLPNVMHLSFLTSKCSPLEPDRYYTTCLLVDGESTGKWSCNGMSGIDNCFVGCSGSNPLGAGMDVCVLTGDAMEKAMLLTTRFMNTSVMERCFVGTNP